MQVLPEGAVTLTFEDNTTATGACVIGADGSHSKVRDFLCGGKAQTQDTGITMINHVTKFDAATAKLMRIHHPIVKLAFGPTGNGGLMAGTDGSSVAACQKY
jgi:2-polyprenyl-6-methoxyphenol hydroxylase-like FAD-dependent oxidoreductase